MCTCRRIVEKERNASINCDIRNRHTLKFYMFSHVKIDFDELFDGID